SACRSLRALGDRGRRLRQVVHRTRVCVCSCANDRGAVPGFVPGVPAQAEAGQLLGRGGDGDADEIQRQQLAARSRPKGELMSPQGRTITRRAVLSALAVLPTVSSPFFPVASQAQAAAPDDPLPSWNEGPARQAITTFVKETTDQASPKFVPVAERIATFDQ